MYIVKFKKLVDHAILPTKKHDTDAGYDLYASEDVTIEAGSQRVVNTGIQLANIDMLYYSYAFPLGDDEEEGIFGDVEEVVTELKSSELALLIWPRSGLDAKFGLHTGAGVVDAGYRGEILVLIKNMGTEPYEIKRGDKIAQMVPTSIPHIVIEEVTEIIDTDRGESGGINQTNHDALTIASSVTIKPGDIKL